MQDRWDSWIRDLEVGSENAGEPIGLWAFVEDSLGGAEKARYHQLMILSRYAMSTHGISL
jgi:hypothetical protein